MDNTVRITRKEFCELLNSAQKAYEQIQKIADCGLALKDGSSLFLFIDKTINTLSYLMYDDDTYPFISSFCWECDFGKSDAVEVWIGEEDSDMNTMTECISASNSDELYSLVLKVYQLKELF